MTVSDASALDAQDEAESEPRSHPSGEVIETGTADRPRAPVLGPVDMRSLALSGLLVLAVLYTLHVARPLLLPVVTAVLASFLLSPPVAFLSRLGLPRAVAAATVLLTVLALAGLALWGTFEPANEWLGEAPKHLSGIERKLREAIRPVEQVGEAALQVEKLAKVGQADDGEVLKVSDGASLGETIFSGTQRLLAAAAVVLALLFFLLASEDQFLRKVVRVLPRLGDKKRAVEIARQTQRDVSVHLATITLINIVLGAVVWLAMDLLGMPNPLLWGVMCAALNYVPYLGAAVGVLIVGGVALLTFDDIARALLVACVYGLVTGIEGSLVTPAVLGRRLALNPVVVFLGVFFWGWIWGPFGALLAVPILLVLKTFCDHVPRLSPLGEFLGR
jgi:predicted PurR-regulated permease PerM